MKKLALFILFLIPLNVFAEDITKSSKILIGESSNITKFTDENENTYSEINKDEIITITNENDIHGIYIIYELKSVTGTIRNNTKDEKIGLNNFLHEYIDVEKLIGASKEITMKFDDNVKIGEIYVLSEGELPKFVEIWDTPSKEADLLLFSTHSDDEQLFFAGLLPYYVAKGANVQVVYFTNHNNTPKRLHEQLHGLYVVGIRHYPIIGFVPDAYSESLDGALRNLNNSGYKEDDAIKFMVQMIRRFKPLVVVGHDEKGEYSHGQHILCTHVLKKALELANDESYDTESKDNYGVWDVKKTYLHLYKDNEITMNYDEPLLYFNGKTAYEVSKEGYKEHHSQQYTWFTKWLTGVNSSGQGTPFTKGTEIKTYSPLKYGLYKSTVGEDKNKNDMFENLKFRKDEMENSKNDGKIKEDNNKDNTEITVEKENKILEFIINVIKDYFLLILAIIILLILIIKKK